MNFPLEHRYYKYSYYLKNKFGEKVYKVPVNAGFTCPTRDGHLGTGGCIYCNNASFSPTDRDIKSIDEQIEAGIQRLQKRNIYKYLIYFQSYTNTYAPCQKLEKLYRKALDYKGVVGLCIGTRPDCVGKDVLSLLNNINQDTYISLEIGIESVYNKTLEWVRRGHDFQTTQAAIARIKEKNIHVSGHYILGFPTETKKEMLASAEKINRLQIDAIKLHHLHIVKNTKLAKIYKKSPFELFSAPEWINLIVEYLERLDAGIVIQRLMGDARGDTLIAPQWDMNKFQILSAIKDKLAARDSHQGGKAK
ncbi:MAG: TIGR01212 family radical SAM protein [Candidatus Marinimicrobia bacterium]|nr:TIGR01212 family radical SAM protein [Candidatus Neomarinimicrobiota bacterium]